MVAHFNGFAKYLLISATSVFLSQNSHLKKTKNSYYIFPDQIKSMCCAGCIC